MEALVGFDEETAEIERIFFGAGKKNRAGAVAWGKSRSRGGAAGIFQSSAPAEGASRGHRPDREVSFRIQRRGEAIAAVGGADRKHCGAKSEVASRGHL